MSDQVESTEKKAEDWMSAKWRPAMGWLYMLVCLCDFVVFPVLWSIYHAILHTGQFAQWQPITLQGAGLFHLSMGAIIGVAAFGRTQEKLAGANNGGLQPPGGFGMPSPTPSFGAPATPAPAFGSAPSPAPAFGSPAPARRSFTPAAPSAPAMPATSACGRPMPVQEEQPEL